jgi:hypothetical protein
LVWDTQKIGVGKKFVKGPVATTNFLEVLVNDEEIILS